VGIVSEMGGHDANGWPAWVRTPYGTTHFHFSDVWLERTITIRHPDGGREAYGLYDLVSTNLIPSHFTSMPVSPLGTLENGYRNHANTLHWNRQQFAQLTTTNLIALGAGDFRRGRLRHWLNIPGYQGDYSHADTIAHEQDPSPDGVTDGQVTFYDYDGKAHIRTRGSQVLPGVVARLMPDGTTQSTRYERNSIGNITRTIERWSDSAGIQYRTNTFTYAANGIDLLLHVGPDGHREVGYAYDVAHPHQPVRLTNAVGEVTFFTYNAARQLTSITTPANEVTTHTYDANHRRLRTVVSHLSTPISTNQFTWSGGRLRTHTDPRGFTLTNTWDALGRLTRVDYPDGTSERHLYTFQASHGLANLAAAYPNGNGSANLLDRTAFVNRLGQTNFTTWDSLRRRAFTRDTRGTLTAYQYCDCGSPADVTVGSGISGLAETTSYAYDQQGRLLRVTHPGFGVETNVYDLPGRLVARGDALGWTTNVWDNLGRLVAVHRAAGLQLTNRYGIEDQLLVTRDAHGMATTNTWDQAHRLVARSTAAGSQTFGYTTGQSGPSNRTNELGHVMRWSRDASGRLTNEVSLELRGGSLVALSTNRYAYDGTGAMTDLWDGNSQRTQWRYDLQGRVSAKLYANNVTNLTYLYDALGRLTNRWSQAKGNTAYAYDAGGSLVTVNYPVSPDLSYAYDALGRLTNMVDAVGTTRYTHAHGLLTTEDGPWANDTVAWDYHNARIRSALRLQQTSTSWWTNSYAWDASRRLSTVTSPAGTFTYGYTGAGNLRSGYSAPGGSVTNVYDSLGRLTLTAWRNTSGTVLNAHGYELDAASQRTRQTRTNSTASHSHTLGYQYDGLGQVTHARATNNATGLPVSGELLGLTYDAAWNMTARTNGTTVNYAVNNLNQVTGDGGTYTYTYDSNGNRASREAGGGATVWLVYDDENQLIRQETDTWNTPEANRFRLEYVYDGKLRLRERRYFTWLNGTWYSSATDRYVYDGMLVVQERSTTAPTVSYTRGVDLSGGLDGAGGIGGLLARSHGFSSGTGAWSAHTAYHADGNGNVTALFSTSTGSQVGWYRYDAFGRLLGSSGTLAGANLMRFSSKPWMAPEVDDTAGMYYYGYRFYDPLTQRWPNRDPLEEEGGINLYGFVQNKPTGRIDISGLFGIDLEALLTGETNPTDEEFCEAYNAAAEYTSCWADCMKRLHLQAGAMVVGGITASLPYIRIPKKWWFLVISSGIGGGLTATG